MPNLGHTMEEGRLAGWLKAVGDPVSAGEVIATVESDKATFDVEAPGDGVLLAIHVPAGTTVPVGTVVGRVGQPGERAKAPGAAPVQAPAAAPPPATAPETPRPARANASPAARTLAAELGIDLLSVSGTGDGGAITRDDVRAHAAALARPASVPEPSPMRRAIAAATEAAWRTIPHVTLIRRTPVSGTGNVTARVVRAAAQALRRHTTFNGWWVDARFRPAPAVDVAVAVTTGDGLLMPAVRTADGKDLAAIGAAIASLAEHARAGSLDGSATVDASFTVSSLGRWGVEAFTPVINAPQVAILGVGAADRVAREAPGGGVVFRNELTLCLVFDHRANDGVAAAEFLRDIAATLSEDAQ